jgi:hypothetical protein
MQPSSVLANSASTLVAADVANLAAATATKLHLAIAAFVPSLALTMVSFTEATFTGYAPLAAGATGAQTQYFDPATGNSIVEVKAPAGGWFWKCTGGAGLPQTVYGSYLSDNGSANLLGSQLLANPITVTASGQGLEVPNVRFNFPPSPMT